MTDELFPPSPAEILAIVAKWDENDRESFEERAAIIEAGGRITRERAEYMAYIFNKQKRENREHDKRPNNDR
jgi:hypothetical protein